MRITTGMIANQYTRSLNQSLGKLNYYNNRATTFRRFDSASEDPVSAAKAYSLRRSYSQNEDYLVNINDTENLFQTAHSTKLSINSILEEIGSNDILQGINGTYSKEDRNIVATKIARLQESILTNANAKYGDKYMFNGGDYTKPPFSLDKDGNLLYRGINVNTGIHVGNTAGPNTAIIDGAKIDFGRENADLLNDYKVEFSTDAVGTNSFDDVNKKIVIGTGGGAMTAADLQNQLQNLLQPPTPNLPNGFDPSKISVTGDVKGSNLPITGPTIGLGNAGLLDGYTIEFSTDDVGTNSVDKDSKKIIIGSCTAPGGKTMNDMTAADLEAQLRGLDPTSLPDGVDLTQFTVTGANAEVVSKSAFVQKSSLATNQSAEAYLGGSIVNMGRANGDLLNGYTLNVVEGPAAIPPALPSAVDNDKKVITITLPAGSTKQDLEDALKGMNPADLPLGTDPTKISIGGDKTTAVNFVSAEINGGEKSIDPGTKFDLDALANETRYVDLGLGLSFNVNDKLDEQSVFDISMTGLSMLGFGMNDDGSPRNVYSQITQIIQELKSDDFNIENIAPMMENLNKQKDNLLYNITDTDSKTSFITFTKERLTDSKINLNTKMVSVEMIEPSEAIMDFKMQEYAYMAALQMGSKIIQPTFLDFMR